jgi:hypothetical protein
MKKSLFVLATAALVALPGTASAQGFGIAGRAGTLGVGAEAALGLSDAFVIRGGLGLLPIETDISDLVDVGTNAKVNLTFPKTWVNIGADLYLGGSMRIGGGILFKPDNPEVEGSLTAGGKFEIGGKEYTVSEVAAVKGTLNAKKQVPYFLVGFGKHTKSGIGLFLDVGGAYLGDNALELSATGNPAVINSADFQTRLNQEEKDILEELPVWARKFWPILSIGIKLGIG